MEQLLTEQEVATYLQLSVQTLQRWRHFGVGPEFVKAQGAVRYRTADLARYLDACLVDPATRRAAKEKKKKEKLHQKKKEKEKRTLSLA